jgi:hypothetical protein
MNECYVLLSIDDWASYKSTNSLYDPVLRIRGGGDSGDYWDQLLQRQEHTGSANPQRYTPEQYREMGIDGAYYDSNGCIQFAPPGVVQEKKLTDSN